MITQIGIAAGEIWQYLDQHEHGSVKLKDIIESVNRPRDLLLMSLGWLAREGHVKLEGDKDYIIILNK